MREERGGRRPVLYERAIGCIGSTTIIFFLLLIAPSWAAQATYPGANGSNDGYITSYDYAGTSGTGLRVSLSTNRPDYSIKDSVGIRIRTDGYFWADCGWWYVLPSGSINSLTISDPTGKAVRSYSSETTDEKGIWEDLTALRLSTSMPPGKYKVNATIIGDGRTLTGEYLTIYFDVLGLLNTTVITNQSITRNQNLTINVTVREEGSGTPVQGADVTVQVLTPDKSGSQFVLGQTDVNGRVVGFYNGTLIGDHFIVAFANKSAQYDFRGENARDITHFCVEGTWPDSDPRNSLGTSLSRIFILFFISSLLVSRRRIPKGPITLLVITSLSLMVLPGTAKADTVTWDANLTFWNLTSGGAMDKIVTSVGPGEDFIIQANISVRGYVFSARTHNEVNPIAKLNLPTGFNITTPITYTGVTTPTGGGTSSTMKSYEVHFWDLENQTQWYDGDIETAKPLPRTGGILPDMPVSGRWVTRWNVTASSKPDDYPVSVTLYDYYIPGGSVMFTAIPSLYQGWGDKFRRTLTVSGNMDINATVNDTRTALYTKGRRFYPGDTVNLSGTTTANANVSIELYDPYFKTANITTVKADSGGAFDVQYSLEESITRQGLWRAKVYPSNTTKGGYIPVDFRIGNRSKRSSPYQYTTCGECHDKVAYNSSTWFQSGTVGVPPAHPGSRPFASRNPSWLHNWHMNMYEMNISRSVVTNTVVCSGATRATPGKIKHFYRMDAWDTGGCSQTSAYSSPDTTWINDPGNGEGGFWELCTVCHMNVRIETGSGNSFNSYGNKMTCTTDNSKPGCHVVTMMGAHKKGPGCIACHGSTGGQKPDCDDCHLQATATWGNDTGPVSAVDDDGYDYTLQAEDIDNLNGSLQYVQTGGGAPYNENEELIATFPPRYREDALTALVFRVGFTVTGTPINGVYLYYWNGTRWVNSGLGPASSAGAYIWNTGNIASTAGKDNGYYKVKLNYTAQTNNLEYITIGHMLMDAQGRDTSGRTNDTHFAIPCLTCHGHSHDVTKPYCTECHTEMKIAETSPHYTEARMFNPTYQARAEGGYYESTADWVSVDSRVAQVFQVTGVVDVVRVALKLQKVGSPTDKLNLTIRESLSDQPLAYSFLDASTVPTTTTWVSFNFTGTNSTRPLRINSSYEYYMVLNRTGATDGSNYVRAYYGTTELYDGGDFYNWTGSAWQKNTSRDLDFDVFHDTSCVDCHGGKNRLPVFQVPDCRKCHNTSATGEMNTRTEMPPYGLTDLHGRANFSCATGCHGARERHNLTRITCTEAYCHNHEVNASWNGTAHKSEAQGGINYTIENHAYNASGWAGNSSEPYGATCIDCHDNGTMVVTGNGSGSNVWTTSNLYFGTNFHATNGDWIKPKTDTTHPQPTSAMALCTRCHRKTVGAGNAPYNSTNHQSGADDGCSCHSRDGGSNSEPVYHSANITKAGGGPDCGQGGCHDGTLTSDEKAINWSAVAKGIHKNLNKNVSAGSTTLGNITRICWACHGSGNGSSGDHEAGAKGVSVKSPYVCNDCHVEGGSAYGRYKPTAVENSKVKVAEHLPDTYGITPNILTNTSQGGNNRSGDCMDCHENNVDTTGDILQGISGANPVTANISHYGKNDSLMTASINSTNCSYCHVPSSNTIAMTWGDAIIINGKNGATANAPYKNHSLAEVGDGISTCDACHNNTGVTSLHSDELFIGGGGPNCGSCHNSLGEDKGINITSISQGIHKDINSNVSADSTTWGNMTRVCWACHGERTSNTGDHAAGAKGVSVKSPRTCEDCHTSDNSTWIYPPVPVIYGAFHSQTGGINVTVTCVQCHNNSLVTGEGAVPGDTFGINDIYVASINASVSHYGRIPQPNVLGNGCASCHKNASAGARYGNATQIRHADSDINNSVACSKCHNTSIVFYNQDGSGSTPLDGPFRSLHDQNITNGSSAKYTSVHYAFDWEGDDFNDTDGFQSPSEEACTACHNSSGQTGAGDLSMARMCEDCHLEESGGLWPVPSPWYGIGHPEWILRNDYYSENPALKIPFVRSHIFNASGKYEKSQINVSNLSGLLFGTPNAKNSSCFDYNPNTGEGSCHGVSYQYRGVSGGYYAFGRDRSVNYTNDTYHYQVIVDKGLPDSRNCTICHNNPNPAMRKAWGNATYITHATTKEDCWSCHVSNGNEPSNFHNDTLQRGGGPDCVGCHNGSTLATSINHTAFNNSLHANIDDTGNSEYNDSEPCWLCHNGGIKPADGEHNIVTYSNPKNCTDCHLAGGSFRATAALYGAPVILGHGNTSVASCGVEGCHNSSQVHIGTMVKRTDTTNISNSRCGPCHNATGGRYFTSSEYENIWVANHTTTTSANPNMNCTYCHDNRTYAKEVGGSGLTLHSMNLMKNTSFTCITCHTNTTGQASGFVAANRVIKTHYPGASPGKANMTNRTNPLVCEDCHNATGRNLHSTMLTVDAADNANGTCYGCHHEMGTFHNKSEKFMVSDPVHNKTYGRNLSQACERCHNYNGTDRFHFNEYPTAELTLAGYMGYTAWSGWTNGTVPNCSSCHIERGNTGPFWATNVTNGTSKLNVNESAPMGNYNLTQCIDCHVNTTGSHVNTYKSHRIREGAGGECATSTCHSVDQGNQTSKVVNITVFNSSGHGVLNIGNGTNGPCYACHGDGTPPPEGQHSTSYTAPKDCPDCHTNKTVIEVIDAATGTGNGLYGSAWIGQHNPYNTLSNVTTNATCVDCHLSAVNSTGGTGNQNASTNVSHYLIVPTLLGGATSNNCSYCHKPDTELAGAPPSEKARWGIDVTDSSFANTTMGSSDQECWICHSTRNLNLQPGQIPQAPNNFHENTLLPMQWACQYCHPE